MMAKVTPCCVTKLGIHSISTWLIEIKRDLGFPIHGNICRDLGEDLGSLVEAGKRRRQAKLEAFPVGAQKSTLELRGVQKALVPIPHL